MKKSELRQLIKEEIQNILKEEYVEPLKYDSDIHKIITSVEDTRFDIDGVYLYLGFKEEPDTAVELMIDKDNLIKITSRMYDWGETYKDFVENYDDELWNESLKVDFWNKFLKQQ
jgi:hypothetical protein